MEKLFYKSQKWKCNWNISSEHFFQVHKLLKYLIPVTTASGERKFFTLKRFKRTLETRHKKIDWMVSHF